MITSTILIDFLILFKTKIATRQFTLILLGWLTLSTPILASPYSAVYVFGDSLSDTDNNLIALFLPTPPYSLGRVSNGPVWIEYLTAQLALTYDPVRNFAWAGAKTSEDFGLLPGLLAQVDYCIEHYSVDVNGLYFIWIGANDLFTGLDAPETTVATATRNIATAIERLISYGAQHILLLNVPDLGQTPEAQGKETALTTITQAFNQALEQLVEELTTEVVYIDMFAFTEAVMMHPKTFGFQNTVEPCFAEDREQICSDPDSYFFWDDKHPTTTAHQILATHIAKTVAVPSYHSDEELLYFPSVTVVTATELVGFYEAILRLETDTEPPQFILVEAKDIVAHNVLAEPTTFNVETGLLDIPFVEVDEDRYHAKLILESNTSNFVITEISRLLNILD